MLKENLYNVLLNQDACSNEQANYFSFINKQTSTFEKGSVSSVDISNINLWNNQLKKSLGLIRIQVANGEVKIKSYYSGLQDYAVLLNSLKNTSKLYNLPNVDFFILREDKISGFDDYEVDRLLKKFPFFVMSKNTETHSLEFKMLLLPDGYMLDPRKWLSTRKDVYQIDTSLDAHSKVEKVFFRGYTTGDNCTFSMWYNSLKDSSMCSRLKLALQSQEFPSLIDAKFSSSYDTYDSHLKRVGVCCDPENPMGHLKYKYLISLDGHTSAWLRVPWILGSHSLLLKEDSEKIEWFYHHFRPYHNYIPINNNLTDIIAVINDLNFWSDNSTLNLTINANKLTEEVFSYKAMYRYIKDILDKYADLQDFVFTELSIESDMELWQSFIIDAVDAAINYTVETELIID